jgi:hypothetical protein
MSSPGPTASSSDALPPVIGRWFRIAWRALLHLMTVRRETWPMLVLDSKGRNSKITEAQMSCSHPRGQRRRSGNRYGRYEHCGRCGLRLKFTTAAAAEAEKAAAVSSGSGLTQAQRLDCPPCVPNAKSKAKAKAQAAAATATTSPTATSEAGSTDLASAMLRMADSQRIQSETLSQGMQAMLQQQSALMQQQNQITGTMLQSLDRLQQTMEVMATPTFQESPPAMEEPPPAVAHPSVAAQEAAARIPVVDVVDLTVDDTMGDWELPKASNLVDLTADLTEAENALF